MCDKYTHTHTYTYKVENKHCKCLPNVLVNPPSLYIMAGKHFSVSFREINFDTTMYTVLHI